MSSSAETAVLLPAAAAASSSSSSSSSLWRRGAAVLVLALACGAMGLGVGVWIGAGRQSSSAAAPGSLLGSSSGSTTTSVEPGAAPSAVPPSSGRARSAVVINELCPAADAEGNGWVELFNAGVLPAAVGGYVLRPHEQSAGLVQLPRGAVVPAGGFLLVEVNAEQHPHFFASTMNNSAAISSAAATAAAAAAAAVVAADADADANAANAAARGAAAAVAAGEQHFGTVFLLDPSGADVLDTAVFSSVPSSSSSSSSSSFSVGSSFMRFPDGGFWAEAPTTEPTPAHPNRERGGADSAWKAGEFSIHVFDAGQGDAQLVTFPSGFTVLVDTAELNWNSDNGAESVAGKLRAVLGSRRKHIDVIVVSHLHLDHIGYAGYGGLWGLLEKEGYTVGQFIDRDAGVWVDRNGDGECDPKSDEIQWRNAGTTSGTATNWICYATNPANKEIYNARQTADICSTTQISPPDAEGAVQIIAADGIGAMMHDGKTPLSGDHTQADIPPSENGFSLGLLFKYGNIHYLTAGDLDGSDASSKFGYTYNDVESIVAKRLGDEVDLYRADHHGSAHSTNIPLVNAMQPTVSLISCGVENSYGHPAQVVLDRLLETGDVALTNLCTAGRDYGTSRFAGGDIVVRSVDGGKTYTVSGAAMPTLTYDAKPKKGSFGAACNAP